MNPLQGPRRRWQKWLDARHPRSDVHAMGQHNIYIVPSRPGLFFCVTIGILLIASINDQLTWVPPMAAAMTKTMNSNSTTALPRVLEVRHPSCGAPERQ